MGPGSTSSASPLCSLIVRAYNEQQHIRRLLAGIRQQTVQDLEVILVDSGSTDDTIAAAQEAASDLPLQVVHIQPEEFTFGRSLNFGVSAAHAEKIVIASAHVYPVYPDWLERLLAPFSDSQVALSYGRQSGSASSRFAERQVFARWYGERSQPRQTHPFCNNANAAIRRSLWVAHPYDESLTGLEDLAWARWAMGSGYALAYVAEAEVIHVHAETPRNVYNRYRREAIAFRRIFPEERFGPFDLLHLVTSNILSDLWHAARQGSLSANLGSIFWYRWMQFWGTYQGYRHSGPLTWQLRRTFYYPNQLDAPSRQPARSVAPIQYPDPADRP